ncbi:MAG: MaoC family dehydratase N-terminal domain-containing protein, partial [Gammaproteobacteria bacterium]
DWIGRTEHAEDVITVQTAAAMGATLDRDDPPPQEGDPLPPLWHWMYFTPKVRRSGLGLDGHPERGGFMPPVSLPRRLFAGASYRSNTPLRLGETVSRTSKIIDVTSKQGRSGPLVFVKVRYVYSMGTELALEEIQNIVYREVAITSETQAPEPAEIEDGAWRRSVTADPVTLFRYSALTFNGHRIHYDYPYVTGVEGYPDLVVHGPLIASYLVELCREKTDDRAIASFYFRAKRPLFANTPFKMTGGLIENGSGFRLKALSADGAEAMEAGGYFVNEGN